MNKKKATYIYYSILFILAVISLIGCVVELEKNPCMALPPQTWGAYVLMLGPSLFIIIVALYSVLTAELQPDVL